MKKMFAVSFEINTMADDALNAAEIVREMLLDSNTGFMFAVQDTETKQIYSVDLDEDKDLRVLEVSPETIKPIIESAWVKEKID